MKKKLLSIVILVLMVCLNISITVEVFATSASKDVSVESFETINTNNKLLIHPLLVIKDASKGYRMGGQLKNTRRYF